MIVQYKNVTIDIDHKMNLGELHFGSVRAGLGYCDYTFPDGMLQKFLESDESGMCKQFERDHSSEDENESSNPDTFVSFLDWYDLNYPKEENIIIRIAAENPYWVFHDLCHSKERDVIGCEANITAYIERDRLQKGYDLMKELSDYDFSSEHLEYLEAINDSFYIRFKERLGLDCFDPENYYEYEEEEEEYY